MKIKKVVLTGIVLILCLSLTACGDYGKYAQAVKEQNIALQVQADKEDAKREAAQRKHEEKMLTLTNSALQAAALTPEKTDDVTTPLMIMVLEDKWQTSRMLADSKKRPAAVAQIQAPTTIGDEIKKAGSTLLGLGGIYLGVRQSDNMADVAKAGIAGAGTHNTATDGSSINTATDGSAINSGEGTATGNKPADSYNDNSKTGDSALEEPAAEPAAEEPAAEPVVE